MKIILTKNEAGTMAYHLGSWVLEVKKHADTGRASQSEVEDLKSIMGKLGEKGDDTEINLTKDEVDTLTYYLGPCILQLKKLAAVGRASQTEVDDLKSVLGKFGKADWAAYCL